MLTLPTKKKWFDMILSGEKKEEYRDIKPYYTSRFTKLFQMYPYSSLPTGLDRQKICFRNGYSSCSPSFVALCSLDIKTGNVDWGAELDKEYYVLSIERISQVKKISWEK